MCGGSTVILAGVTEKSYLLALFLPYVTAIRNLMDCTVGIKTVMLMMWTNLSGQSDALLSMKLVVV